LATLTIRTKSTRESVCFCHKANFFEITEKIKSILPQMSENIDLVNIVTAIFYAIAGQMTEMS